MNPALLIKLRPTGPWRIGPDSGARNQVDAIYHSDTLYAAVTSAMLRLGSLPEWLAGTAGGNPALCFSSCFPFLDEIGFVVPPRTIWPPSSPALLSARVRWKSARFVPLGIVQGLLSGQPLDEEQWAVDGHSGCLVPAGRTGPFRPGLRFNAAVDRLTGAAERHSVACLEFRPGAGLWTLVRFTDQHARERWLDPVKTAFRLLADSGFGGERSLGWGRAEMPEFIEGTFPEMILASEAGQALPPASAEPLTGPEVMQAPSSVNAEQLTSPEVGQAPLPASAEQLTGPEAGPTEQVEQARSPANAEEATGLEATEQFPPANGEHGADTLIPDPQSPVSDALTPETPAIQPAPVLRPPAAHWLLSLFTPASIDSIDWTRGNYTVLIRGGRVEAPSRSGDLKRQLQMVAEGSVLYAASAPRGSAPDVAPEGFAHPVFRAGFAVSIPLPEPAGPAQTGQGTAPPAAKVS
jgi:CRISPR type III-A-associated RAMP protein Csm4